MMYSDRAYGRMSARITTDQVSILRKHRDSSHPVYTGRPFEVGYPGVKARRDNRWKLCMRPHPLSLPCECLHTCAAGTRMWGESAAMEYSGVSWMKGWAVRIFRDRGWRNLWFPPSTHCQSRCYLVIKNSIAQCYPGG